MKKNQFKNK